MISLSTRGLIATLAMVVTVPSASSRTGTDFLTALATVTPHHPLVATGRLRRSLLRRRAVPEKYANPGKGEPRSHPHNPCSFLHVALSARLRSRCPALPHSAVAVSAPVSPSSTGSCSTLPHPACTPVLAGEHREPAFASNPFGHSRSRACWLKFAAQPDPAKIPHAHRHLERQFGQAANREPDRLARRAGARHRLPAGNQDRRRGIPARRRSRRWATTLPCTARRPSTASPSCPSSSSTR